MGHFVMPLADFAEHFTELMGVRYLDSSYYAFEQLTLADGKYSALPCNPSALPCK